MFATVFCGVLDITTGEMEFANAGHNRPLVCTGSGPFQFIPMDSGIPIGVAEGLPFGSGRIRLSVGDILFLYTDGVTEAMDQEGRLFSEARLQETLTRLRNESTENILHKTRAEIAAFVAETPQSDDITMVVLKYRGSGNA